MDIVEVTNALGHAYIDYLYYATTIKTVFLGIFICLIPSTIGFVVYKVSKL